MVKDGLRSTPSFLQTLADEVPYIPLYYPDILIGARSSVDGLVVLPNGSIRLEDVRLAK
ncbi:hypothetical protein ACFSQ7_27170 [Paenibacillus rhizoplanae]